MHVPICQESLQDVFSHAVQVVIRQGHISVFQGLFVKHLVLRLHHLLSLEGFLFSGLNSLLFLMYLSLPLHVDTQHRSYPCAIAVCCSVNPGAFSAGCRLRPPCVGSLAASYSRATDDPHAWKWEEPTVLNFSGCRSSACKTCCPLKSYPGVF